MATKWTKDAVQELLARNDQALIRGLQVIYALQTTAEQADRITRERNNVGFSGVHSEFASSLAEQYARRGFLTTKQLTALRKIMKHYAGQLAKVANGEIPNPLGR